jgi:hypothetical protein
MNHTSTINIQNKKKQLHSNELIIGVLIKKIHEK